MRRRTSPPSVFVFAAILSVIGFCVSDGLMRYTAGGVDATDAGIIVFVLTGLWTGFWLSELADDLAEIRGRRQRGRMRRRGR